MALSPAAGRARRRAAPPARRRPASGCCTSRASPPSSASPSPRATAWSSAPAADGPDVAEEAIARMRFALGVDDDLRPFYERFRYDPLIGRSVRARPQLRVHPPARAVRGAGLGDLPSSSSSSSAPRRSSGGSCGRSAAAARAPACATCPPPRPLAGAAPAQLQSLRPQRAARAIALLRAAREVAAGRVDLRAPTTSAAGGGCARSRASARGRSRCSRCTARAATTSCPPATWPTSSSSAACAQGGNPRARATEDEVREFFAPYERLGGGLAGARTRSASAGASEPAQSPALQPAPGRAGTRSSARGRPPAGCVSRLLSYIHSP